MKAIFMTLPIHFLRAIGLTIFILVSATITRGQIINTIAGNGVAAYSGDSGLAVNAQLNTPWSVSTDVIGNIYLADHVNHRIRKINAATGIISTVAGNGIQGFSGDGGLATSASLNGPTGVAVDASGNIYFADKYNHRIRKITAASGILTTIAGNGMPGVTGDGGPATSASISDPRAIAVDASGNIYIVDLGSYRIRKVTQTTGIISTVAGNGGNAFSGDGGPATSAGLMASSSVAVDLSGNIYIGEYGDNRVRKVTVSTGIINTMAGNGIGGFGGDGGPATSASLDLPFSLATVISGNVYIGEYGGRVREVKAATGIITTVAGSSGWGFSGDGGLATNAFLNYPNGVSVDLSGNIYIADYTNNRIRKVTAIATNTINVDPLSTTSYCAGAALSIPFNSTGTFGGGNSYTAQLSDAAGVFGTPVAIGTLSSPGNAGIIPANIPIGTPSGTGYRIRIISSNPATIGTDNGVDIVINSATTPPGIITGDTNVCAGSSNSYSVPNVAGNTYTWVLPATFTGSSTTNNITTIAGTASGTISVSATGVCGPSPARTFPVTVFSSVTPQVSINALPNPLSGICAGAPVAFTAVPIFGGTAPTYQWLRNGAIIAGATGTVYTTSTLQASDAISVQMASSYSCRTSPYVFSQPITFSINPSVAASININSFPSTFPCANAPVTFVTNIVAGGSAPQYQWYRNNIAIAGSTATTFTSATFATGDTIAVLLTSNAACVTNPMQLSNKVRIDVLPIVTPTISITANPDTRITYGQTVLFTANYTNSGPTLILQWMKNNVAIPFATNTTYSSNTLMDGDLISVRMTTTAPCVTSLIVDAAAKRIESATRIEAIGSQAGILHIYPNPNSGHFTIGMAGSSLSGKRVKIEIINTLGQAVYHTEVVPDTQNWSLPVWIGEIANGVYQVRVSHEGMQTVQRVLIQR